MSVLILTDKNFDKEVLKSKNPVLVDFWAPWCGPCKMMAPIIEELAKDFDGKAIKIGKLNVDENSNVSAKYSIMSIPTVVFFKEGKPMEQMVGVQSKDAFKKIINKLLK